MPMLSIIAAALQEVNGPGEIFNKQKQWLEDKGLFAKDPSVCAFHLKLLSTLMIGKGAL